MGHVLLIEDSKAFAVYVIKCLTPTHTVHVAPCAAAGLRALRDTTRHYDAVLLDLGLPDSPDPRDTWTLFQAPIGDTPVIIVTGNPTTRSGDTVEIVGKDPLWQDETLLGSLVARLLSETESPPAGGGDG